MKILLQQFKKSILAGGLIGLSGVCYLLSPNTILGAFLFSIGLISIIYLQANLYTGKIGYATLKLYKQLFIMLIGNLIGAGIIGIIAQPKIYLLANAIIINKLSLSYLSVFINSLFCGICVYLAVELFKKSNNILTIIIPVWIFVLCGFNHCIADFFFMISGRVFSCLHLFICIIGNSIGAYVINKLTN